MVYVRFESPIANSRGAHIGIFGLANHLADSGQLSPADWSWWRANNDWYEAAYTDPATVDPTLFDRAKNPLVACWFRTTAVHLLDRIPGYLDLLGRHGVACIERTSSDPGIILYADTVQVVVKG